MRITIVARYFFVICVSALFVSEGHSQNRQREGANVQFIWNPENEFRSFDASIGYELLAWSKGYWAVSGTVREAELELNKIEYNMHLKSYGISLPVVHRFNDHWNMIASPKLSVKNASYSFVLQDDTLYPSGVAVVSYRVSPEAYGWTFSAGVVYSKDIDDHFFLPILGAAYSSPPFRVNLGFPNVSFYYQPKDAWEVGLKANFDSGTYTLPTSSRLHSAKEKAFRIRFIDVGPAFNFRIHPHLWINTNLGIVAYAEGHTVSAEGDTQRLLFKGQNPVFVRASISYY